MLVRGSGQTGAGMLALSGERGAGLGGAELSSPGLGGAGLENDGRKGAGQRGAGL